MKTEAWANAFKVSVSATRDKMKIRRFVAFLIFLVFGLAAIFITPIVQRWITGWQIRATARPIIESEKAGAIKSNQITGPLQVHPTNPRYFIDATGQVVYVTGSHTWTSLQDLGETDPPPKLDYTLYLDWMQQYNHNFMRLWAYESAKGGPWSSDDFWFDPLPYERSGDVLALDGKPKFDLTRFNKAYFDRLRARVIEANDHGIYVAVMLFNGWSVDKKGLEGGNPWLGHYLNGHNNVNGVDGDLNGDGEGQEVHTLQDPTITAIQEAYVRKVIDTLNDLDNVLWEIGNEGHNESQDWQYHMINYIKNYETNKPKQHLVGMTVEYPNGTNADLFASPADWISPAHTDLDSYKEDPPVADGSKVIISDTDHHWGVGGDHVWVWKSFLRGHNPIFMDPYDEIVLDSFSSEFEFEWDPMARQAMGYTRIYANSINLKQMVPRSDLASTRYCLANPIADNAEYLVYLPSGGRVTVDLSATPGELAVEWFNPRTGDLMDGGTINGGSDQSFITPFYGDAVLYIASLNISSE